MSAFSGLNVAWTLAAVSLVFFMRAGFVMLETGFTRAKNAGSSIMRHLMDFAIGAPLYWFLGFGIMFGGGALIGAFDPIILADYSGILPPGMPLPVFVILQTVFCGTAATIASGAMAERTKFISYCIYSAAISLFIYPVAGHWIWGGGWLAAIGFHDFAGSASVHMAGGTAAFMGSKLLGPRIGKYNKDGSSNAIPGHSLTLGALGVFILWFGWFGFNGGSTLSMEGENILKAGNIFITTNLAAVAATSTAMLLTWLRYKKPDVSMTLNGSLAGLVAISAGCDSVSFTEAFLIGIIASFVAVYSIEFIDSKLKIDDPVGAVGVHGVCGALGAVLVGLFSQSQGFLHGHGPGFLGVQLLGVLAVAVWTAATVGLVFYITDKTVGLRVSAEEEIKGLDAAEHGLTSSVHGDLLPTDFLPNAKGSTLGIMNGTDTPERAIPFDEKNDDAVITKVTIIFNPMHLNAMKMAMNEIGITGMTVTNVMGCGIQKGRTDYYRGVNVVNLDLLPKLQMDIVVTAVPVERVVQTAQSVLHTGHIGDGKIFIYRVENVLKISTGEQGFAAMQGSEL